MKKLNVILSAAALILVLSVSVRTTMAYFTDRTSAEGGYTISLGTETRIEEEFYNWTKVLTITNEETSEAVYVRARAFVGDHYSLTYTGTDWTEAGDGFCYYGGILEAGQSAEALEVKIGDIPEEVIDGKRFDVVVIYESTPVLYDEAGTPYADWNIILDNGSAAAEEGEASR